MVTELKIADVTIEVVKKDIKNIHLSVNPPDGSVKLAAPLTASANVIRTFALAKLKWIRKNRNKMQSQEREKPRQFIERESHYLWGRRYLLHVIEGAEKTAILTHTKRITLKKRKSISFARLSQIFDQFYKDELLAVATPKILKWAKTLGVQQPRLEIRKMKTRWGSCNPRTSVIRLNSELAKRPKELLNYVILHEMAHLIERNHNQRYFDILDRHMPNWQHYRNELNNLPIPYANWR